LPAPIGNTDPTNVTYVDTYGPETAATYGCLANASGQPITNLYAYDTEGRLLDPVLLFDQDGRPIDNLCPELDAQGRRLSTEYRRDANDAPVINAFPRRQTAYVPNQRSPRGNGLSNEPQATVPVKPPAVIVPRLAPTTTLTTAPPGG
jgi:hypothetical protein